MPTYRYRADKCGYFAECSTGPGTPIRVPELSGILGKCEIIRGGPGTLESSGTRRTRADAVCVQHAPRHANRPSSACKCSTCLLTCHVSRLSRHNPHEACVTDVMRPVNLFLRPWSLRDCFGFSASHRTRARVGCCLLEPVGAVLMLVYPGPFAGPQVVLCAPGKTAAPKEATEFVVHCWPPAPLYDTMMKRQHLLCMATCASSRLSVLGGGTPCLTDESGFAHKLVTPVWCTVPSHLAPLRKLLHQPILNTA